MNKQEVIREIIAQLEQEFTSYLAISRKTRSAGNDEQTKAEGKYDTRSTEENYLADGQARQARAAQVAAEIFARMPVVEFPTGSGIGPGALVDLEMAGEKRCFFLGPVAGGMEVRVGGVEVTVITPDSPLGRQLAGLRPGDQVHAPRARVVGVQ